VQYLAIIVERGGHILVSHERKIQREVRALFVAGAPNEE
jgi:hypothetical protein